MTDFSHNPFMKRAMVRAIGSSGRASEQRVARVLGARLQPASGALRGAKADMKHGTTVKFLIEAKSTQAETLRLDLGWLTKVTAEAVAINCKPLLTLSFVDAEGHLRGIREDWVAMPRSAFNELMEACDERSRTD